MQVVRCDVVSASKVQKESRRFGNSRPRPSDGERGFAGARSWRRKATDGSIDVWRRHQSPWLEQQGAEWPDRLLAFRHRDDCQPARSCQSSFFLRGKQSSDIVEWNQTTKRSSPMKVRNPGCCSRVVILLTDLVPEPSLGPQGRRFRCHS